MVELVDINTNDSYSIKYIIKFLRGKKMEVTKELLKFGNVPDTVSIPITSEELLSDYHFFSSQELNYVLDAI